MIQSGARAGPNSGINFRYYKIEPSESSTSETDVLQLIYYIILANYSPWNKDAITTWKFLCTKLPTISSQIFLLQPSKLLVQYIHIPPDQIQPVLYTYPLSTITMAETVSLIEVQWSGTLCPHQLESYPPWHPLSQPWVTKIRPNFIHSIWRSTFAYYILNLRLTFYVYLNVHFNLEDTLFCILYMYSTTFEFCFICIFISIFYCWTLYFIIWQFILYPSVYLFVMYCIYFFTPSFCICHFTIQGLAGDQCILHWASNPGKRIKFKSNQIKSHMLPLDENKKSSTIYILWSSSNFLPRIL